MKIIVMILIGATLVGAAVGVAASRSHIKQSRDENERREEQLVRYCIGYAPLQPVTINKKRSFSF